MQVNKNTIKNNITAIDVAKGIAIILVVFGHLIQYTMMASSEDYFENQVFKIIYSFHMPLFIFISGYLIAFSLEKRNIYDVLKSRIKNLIIPYIAWNVIDILIIIIKNQQLSAIKFIQLTIKMLILSPSIWFLFTLFVLSCLLLTSIKLENLIGIMSHIIIFFLVIIFPSTLYCDIYFIKWFYFYFIVGYFANRYNVSRIYSSQSKLIKIIVVLVAIILFLWLISFWTRLDYIYNNKMQFTLNDYFNEILRFAYRYIVAFLGILITFYISDFLKNIKLQNIFIGIGIYSIDIYLLQRYIVEKFYFIFLKYLYIKFDYNLKLFIGIFVPIITVIVILISIFISRYVLRKNKMLNKFLLGSRVRG